MELDFLFFAQEYEKSGKNMFNVTGAGWDAVSAPGFPVNAARNMFVMGMRVTPDDVGESIGVNVQIESEVGDFSQLWHAFNFRFVNTTGAFKHSIVTHRNVELPDIVIPHAGLYLVFFLFDNVVRKTIPITFLEEPK